MAKFYGLIGFAKTVETAQDVWTEQITERPYYGDLLRNTRQLQASNQLNDDVCISNEISILADPYARENFQAMRYVEFMGAKWKITGVEVQYPRLVLKAGGVYNGDSGPKIGAS